MTTGGHKHWRLPGNIPPTINVPLSPVKSERQIMIMINTRLGFHWPALCRNHRGQLKAAVTAKVP